MFLFSESGSYCIVLNGSLIWFIPFSYPIFVFLTSRFPQVAGIEFGFHPDAEPGHRTVGDSVKDQGLYLKDSKVYHLVIKKYLANVSCDMFIIIICACEASKIWLNAKLWQYIEL